MSKLDDSREKASIPVGILYATIPFMILVVAMVLAPLLLAIRRESREQRASVTQVAHDDTTAGEPLSYRPSVRGWSVPERV